MTAMIRTVVFDGTLRVIECPRPTCATDEVLILPRLTGICNTDLELMRGYQAFSGTLGHEFVGDVVDGPAAWIGRRVVGEINISCGDCDMCKRDIPTQCRRRNVLGIANYDGAFADIFRLALRNILPVPDSIPDEVAVFTEPVAAVCQILDSVSFQPEDRVVLLGAGKLGMLAAQVLHSTGCDLTVIVRREKQAVLLTQWGILAVDRHTVAEGMADVVIECTGNESGFADALNLVRPRGTIVLKSTYKELPQADLTRIVVDEIRVIGSRCGPFDTALQLLAQQTIDVQSLVEACYTFEDAIDAFEHAAQRGVFKVLLKP